MGDPARLWLLPVAVLSAELAVEVYLSSFLACGPSQLLLPGAVILLVYTVFAYIQGRGATALLENPRAALDARDSLLALIASIEPRYRAELLEKYLEIKGLTLLLLAVVAGLVPLVSCQPRMVLPIFLAAVAIGMYTAFLRTRLLGEARSRAEC